MKFTLIMALLLWVMPVKAIKINGVPKDIKENMEHVLLAESDECAVDIAESSLLDEALLDRLLAAIKPFGFFKAEIKTQGQDAAENCKELTYNVTLNAPTTISELTLNVQGSGQNDPAIQNIINQLSLKEGQVLKTFRYDQFKTRLLSESHALGYLDGQFKRSQIKVDVENQLAQVFLVFETGPLYHFSAVMFDQTEHFMDPEFLSKMLNIRTGERVLNESIAKQIAVLNDSLYFSQVTATKANKSVVDATVDLQISVSPAKRIKYSLGLGYATDTGARTTLEYQNDRMGSKAYQFKSQAKIAQTNQDISMRLKIPSRSKPLKKWYAIDTGYLIEDIESKEQKTKKLSFSQSRVYNEQWQNTNYIDITDVDFGFDGERKRSAFLVVPGVSWSWRQADDWVDARKGFSVHAILQGASESLLSDVSFLQTDIKAKWIHPLGDSNRMIYRGQLGATSVDDIKQLPFTYRFYAGGDRSVRGFDYESLSPVDANDDLIGGKHLVVLSAEFEHKWNPRWAWAVFTDAGNAFTDDLNWEKSVGVGLRWFSPLGPVRLDLARAVENGKDNDIKVHFTIGPDF